MIPAVSVPRVRNTHGRGEDDGDGIKVVVELRLIEEWREDSPPSLFVNISRPLKICCS